MSYYVDAFDRMYKKQNTQNVQKKNKQKKKNEQSKDVCWGNIFSIF